MKTAALRRVSALWRALRPEQWTKNLVVPAPLIFAMGDRTQAVAMGLWPRALAAGLLFCCISGGVYLFNDLMDLEADRRHPTKRLRPLAAGELPARAAWPAAAALMLGGLTAGWQLALPLAYYMALYLALQFVYTLWLKHLPLVDILVIAAGFVLRALAGAAAVDVSISVWLVLCAFLLALFLGLCKRRHETIGFTGQQAGDVRPSLAGYRRGNLNRLIVILAAAVILAYAGYVFAPETTRKFGSGRLPLTLPFVIFGVIRYLILVFRHNLGDRPERILLTDPLTILNLAVYGCIVLRLVLA